MKDINGDEIVINNRQATDYDRGYDDAIQDHKGAALIVLIAGVAAGAGCMAFYVWTWGILHS